MQKEKCNYFVFTSVIDTDQRSALEQILFFNKEQSHYYSVIKQVIEMYGKPNITQFENKLNLNFEKIPCQTLFCSVKMNLVGLVVFNRHSTENIDLVHIAVDEFFSFRGKYANKFLVYRILIELIKISLKIKGVKTITIKYGKGQIIDVLEWDKVNKIE